MGGFGGFSGGGQGGPGGGFQGPGRLLDELAKLVTDAAGMAQGARREVETVIKSQGERIIGQMELVQRDEFEAVKEMAAKARLENETLRAELDELKATVAAMTAKPASKAKPAAKKAAPKKD
ncbi:MAG: accessory factor UbiK family protein [Pseudomonadota bacterium]